MACIAKRRGRYVIDCYDQHGKRYRKTLKAGTTKSDARKELREIEDRIARRSFMHDKKTPIFSKVAEDWLDYKKPQIRITTWNMYRGLFKLHFCDLLNLRISTISVATIEKFITKRQAEGMNLNTLRRIICTLNQIMAYAVRHRFIESNPVRDAERPKKQNGQACGGVNFISLSPEQIRSFVDAEEDPKYHVLLLLAVMTGARQGEIIGLKWDDVDFDRQELHIRRTYHHGQFFLPKTKGSIRIIDLPPNVTRELRRWKLACPPNDLNLVFPSDMGTPLDAQNMIHRHFKVALRRAGLSGIRFHDLRHLHASYLIEQGESITYIQHRLGHADPSITLKVYSHLLQKNNPQAISQLENTIFGQTGHNLVTEKQKGLAMLS